MSPRAPGLAAALSLAAALPAHPLTCGVGFEIGPAFTTIHGLAEAGAATPLSYRITAETRANGNVSVSQQSGTSSPQGPDMVTELSQLMVNTVSGGVVTVRVEVTGGGAHAACFAQHRLSGATEL